MDKGAHYDVKLGSTLLLNIQVHLLPLLRAVAWVVFKEARGASRGC